MENKIRKVIKEQIKKLHEGLGTSALQVTTENGVVAIIEDPKDIEAYDRGLTVWGTDADGKEHELNIDWSLDSHMTANEGMSDEEWADAKEAERLKNHPEKDKINKIQQMMDKEKSPEKEYYKVLMNSGGHDLAGYYDDYMQGVNSYDSFGDFLRSEIEHFTQDNQPEMVNIINKEFGSHLDTEQAEYDKGWYGESLKETASKLGYLKEVDGMEEVDEQGLDQIERGINHITDGGRQSARVSDEGDKIKIKFSYARGEFDGETWEAILEYLSDNMGYKILDQSNYYEANYDREEPAEAVPTIYLQK